MKCEDCGRPMVHEYGDYLCYYCDPIDERMDKTLDNQDRMGGPKNEVCDQEIEEWR